MSDSKTFNISLEINVDAKTPLEAAKIVQEWLRDKTTDWYFNVQDTKTKQIYSVDLEYPDDNAVESNHDYEPLIK